MQPRRRSTAPRLRNGRKGATHLSVAAAKLPELVGTLQATHQTLVDSLQPFSETDSKEFLKDWRSVQAKLQSNYYGGKIPSDAHTHCSLLQSIVWQLSSPSNEVLIRP